MTPRVLNLALLALIGVAACGCGQPMGHSGAYKPLDPSPAFADGASSRPRVPNTVERGSANHDSAYFTGVQPDGKLATKPPMPITAETLQRGQERFEIHCAMCHGRDGYGHGVVVQRGFSPPPSYHSAALRNAPIGHFFFVMTYGKGAMYPAASRVSVEDRWAIAAYIRVLQLSQHAQRDDVPPDFQTRLEDSAP